MKLNVQIKPWLFTIIGMVTSLILVMFIDHFFNCITPDTKKLAFSIAGFIFLAQSIIFKTSTGLFYRSSSLKKEPKGYWFNTGEAIGFIVFGLLVI